MASNTRLSRMAHNAAELNCRLTQRSSRRAGKYLNLGEHRNDVLPRLLRES